MDIIVCVRLFTVSEFLPTTLGINNHSLPFLFAANTTLKALKVMEDLKTLTKITASVDSLLVPTLGSQEGAFENVKPVYAGDQVSL